MADPFILLDDARAQGAAPARLYRNAAHIVAAHDAADVLPALNRIDTLARQGFHLAGYLAYEAGAAMEPRTARLCRTQYDAATPLVWFGAFETCEFIEPDAVADWLAGQAAPGEPCIGPLDPVAGPGDYEGAFNRIHTAIAAGDIYQANLTFPLAGPWSGDPIALYRALRPNAEAGYGALIHDGARWLLSFSPELFFALADGEITARPMKGTRPRGQNPQDDAALRADLAMSGKDRAENLMILDLMRNDLSRIAVPGSVKVQDAFAIESYPTVHQMVSTVRARLAPERSASDALLALFPCGSITGAPKIRAMELIAEVEKTPRGAYCGAIGYLEPTGDAAFNVAIRTICLTPGPAGGGQADSGHAVLGVGSAVVADSKALPEWRECLIKGGFVRQSSHARTAMSWANGTLTMGTGPDDAGAVDVRAPAQFDLVETMRFTPETGIALLEGHMARIAASAIALDFAFDRHAVRNAIQALCFEAEQPSRLRLVLGRSGAYALEIADLPAELPDPAICAILPMPVDSGDWRLAHKTTDRWFYTRGLDAARAAGADEALFLRDDGTLTEGCFTNLFAIRGGQLLTPPVKLGLLPGVLRASLLESGQAEEAEIGLADLADGFLIGNAVRGLMPARLLV